MKIPRLRPWLLMGVGIALIVSSAGVFFLPVCFSQTDRNQQIAPDFSLPDVDGQLVRLSEQGDKVILFFWTTWCPYCEEEVPRMNQVYEESQAQAVSVIGINLGESRAKVRHYMSAQHIGYKVLLDTEGRVAGLYGVLGVPTVFILGKGRKVLYQGNRLPGNYQQLFRD